MISSYTLISSIGTGMYKKEGGYRKTNYIFPDGKRFETKIFLESLIHTKYRNIKKVILVGTDTSSWDVLLAESDECDIDLWEKICTECSSSGLSEKSRRQLEEVLSGIYEIPFTLIVHTHVLDKSSIDSIFNMYAQMASLVLPDSNILLDITHGFRSMPVLIYQSLQFAPVDTSPPRVDVVYGEYIDDEKVSYVRDLSQFWDYSELNLSLKLFENKLSGKKLAENIAPYWEPGSKVIARLSEIVECNYSLQVPELLKQMKNVLNSKALQDVYAYWVTDLVEFLKKIYKRLNKPSKSEMLYEYVLLLEEKGLVTQAVIGLQVAVETAVTSHFSGEESIGNYEWWQSNGKSEYERIKNKLDRSDKRSLWELEKLRNGLAHGGGRDRKTNTYPCQVSIPGIMKKAKIAAVHLFELLERS